jgi:hypothetical protein
VGISILTDCNETWILCSSNQHFPWFCYAHFYQFCPNFHNNSVILPWIRECCSAVPIKCYCIYARKTNKMHTASCWSFSCIYKVFSKIDWTFAIKTLLLILQHFKHCPLQSSPFYCWYTIPLLEWFLELSFWDGIQSSYCIFLNLLFVTNPMNSLCTCSVQSM